MIIRILREPERIILCPSWGSTTQFGERILQEELAGINDRFLSKSCLDQVQPRFGTRDDLFLGLTVGRFEIENGRQFTIVVHGLDIINELRRLLFGINIAAEKVIRASQ